MIPKKIIYKTVIILKELNWVKFDKSWNNWKEWDVLKQSPKNLLNPKK
jgi:hypothetical protein